MVNKAVQSFGEKICSYHWDIFEVVPEPEKTEFLKYIDKESP